MGKPQSTFDEVRRCPRCEHTKPHAEFYKNKRQRLSVYCKDCQRIVRNGYYHANPDAARARARATALRLKMDVLEYYGGKCVCCGESNPVFLAIDHKDGGGAKHRSTASLGGGRAAGSSFYRYIRRNGYPAEFQILCNNCNWAKFVTGDCCPHKQPSWMPPTWGGFVAAVL